MNRELVLVLDFGSRHNQLIGRRIREAEVYSEVLPYHTPIDKIKAMNPKGIIFIGDSASIKDPEAKLCDKGIFDLGSYLRNLLWCSVNKQYNGRKFKKCSVRAAKMMFRRKSRLFEKLEGDTVNWINSSYLVDSLPEGFNVTARTKH